MTIQVVVPEMGESVLEATVADWFVEEGDYVEVGEVIVELETDKVNLEVGAKNSGVLKSIQVQAGEDVNVGDVLALIDGDDNQPDEKPVTETSSQPQNTDEHSNERESDQKISGQSTPVAARLAKEEGLDLDLIDGTGPQGRVTKSDVEKHLKEKSEKQKNRQPTSKEIEKDEVQPTTKESKIRREERVKMSRRRRTIAERLLHAQQSTAMLTTFNEINMSAIMKLRSRRNRDFQDRYGIKLGITSFFIKAAISALKAFPRLNAEIHDDEILLKYYYDIGIAIGDEDGLVVPVIRNADKMNFASIEQKINELVTRTKQGELKLEDLQGGTFSITNGGVFGSMLSTPILNPPQVGILGLHKIEDRPIAENGEILIRSMMYVALSYDHRIVDGREAVQFLVHIKRLLEDPEILLLDS